ncbi:helix-turn-helix transcriptional regulator [Actinophytocola sp. NPDC049390]|uniref:helix-turn-helix transcriptional regulator n=1 Tax=Actinophytocola sp. NPDC049390 TaxID=3363894 RepID=UPI00379831F3
MVDETRSSHISAIAALDEPTRRRLYEFVARQAAPVSRDEAADAVSAPRNTVAFHLDKLAAEGLLEVVYQRRTGRSGPGAGRPSKLYRRSPDHITVSLPERRYELAARLMADSFHEAETTGEPPSAVLRRRAHELGKEIGQTSRTDDAMDTLRDFGFEPRPADDTDDADDAVVLVNCPFHSLAQRHTDLVCGMNLCLVDGILDGLATTGLTARLAPEPGHCCVRLERDPGS